MRQVDRIHDQLDTGPGPGAKNAHGHPADTTRRAAAGEGVDIMAGLPGLWRVASFMGLGLCLLGLAYTHQILRKSLQPAPDLEGRTE